MHRPQRHIDSQAVEASQSKNAVLNVASTVRSERDRWWLSESGSVQRRPVSRQDAVLAPPSPSHAQSKVEARLLRSVRSAPRRGLRGVQLQARLTVQLWTVQRTDERLHGSARLYALPGMETGVSKKAAPGNCISFKYELHSHATPQSTQVLGVSHVFCFILDTTPHRALSPPFVDLSTYQGPYLGTWGVR